MNAGIVLRQDSPTARSKAAKCGLPWQFATIGRCRGAHAVHFAGTCVPWDLVAIGFDFLERWDVAAPFWRAGVLAQELGTPAERERTEAILHDLRVPVYAHELLFVRNSQQGRHL